MEICYRVKNTTGETQDFDSYEEAYAVAEQWESEDKECRIFRCNLNDNKITNTKEVYHTCSIRPIDFFSGMFLDAYRKTLSSNFDEITALTNKILEHKDVADTIHAIGQIEKLAWEKCNLSDEEIIFARECYDEMLPHLTATTFEILLTRLKENEDGK